ncbi:MAG: hypothetical protein K0Q76_3575 [Panacagrimonas sp.]|nr:SUMF1/EgtB/PvdO family nonheme iron enzyme [Panacagrimonas sp.]MCC2658467.1 hypothetical protein [Panacagrimonas sp.]
MTDPDRGGARIEAVPYRPPSGVAGAPTRTGRTAVIAALAVVLLCLGGVGAFFAFARSVQFQVDPATAQVDVDGGIGIAMGSSYLLLPGSYQVRARAEGHTDLRMPFTVGDAPDQRVRLALQRLPGRLKLIVEPAAEVFVDGNPHGTTPVAPLELVAGAHELMLRAPRYRVHQVQVQVEGGGVEQTLQVKLEPGWAPVTLRSQPAGAEIRVDGQPAGVTPQTLELGEGAHALELRLAGHAAWQDQITVRANEPLQLAEVRLQAAAGTVRVTSTPSGASVRVGKEFRGQTPIELKLAPGKSHLVQLSAPGHKSAERSVEVASDGSEELSVALEPILGSIALDVLPPEANVSIDGRALATGTSRVDLTAVAHRIEASAPGHAPWSGSITPRPGFEQRVEIRLRSEAEARAARTPAKVASKAGPAMVLVQPGAFVMGTPRGEQGRQSNEALRPVRLTRPYYLSTTEVTNAQYRRFASAHSSGIVKRETLDNDRQPVVRVSWDDAARYCNWLSQQDGLPPAYRDDGGAMKRIVPATTGYRLPSEAEWEWAARFVGGAVRDGQRYPWGGGYPPPARSGNFADVLSEALVPAIIAGYEDGYPAAAPVGTYAASALGLFDLGGNVAEWVHDVYDGTLPIDPPEAADPFGPDGGAEHVIRGSSWMHGRLVELRLAYRDVGREPRADVGFRVARYAE